MNCTALNASGAPCASVVVGDDGLCAPHRDPERLRAAGVKGGEALKAKYATEGLRHDELPELSDHDSAKAYIKVILAAHARRRIGDRELSAQKDVIELWLKVDSAQVTAKVITEVQRKMDDNDKAYARALAEKDREIAALRKQIGGTARLRVTS